MHILTVKLARTTGFWPEETLESLLLAAPDATDWNSSFGFASTDIVNDFQEHGRWVDDSLKERLMGALLGIYTSVKANYQRRIVHPANEDPVPFFGNSTTNEPCTTSIPRNISIDPQPAILHSTTSSNSDSVGVVAVVRRRDRGWPWDPAAVSVVNAAESSAGTPTHNRPSVSTVGSSRTPLSSFSTRRLNPWTVAKRTTALRTRCTHARH